MTDKATAPIAETKASLHAEFPGWSVIFTRDTLRWWAMRIPKPRPPHPRVTEVVADTPDELRARVAKTLADEPEL